MRNRKFAVLKQVIWGAKVKDSQNQELPDSPDRDINKLRSKKVKVR